ncbi:VWA domain-containing protein [Billgrantia montanilacus]|uniref:VWA domain-containing protein n=1 Tax=Billgrantia montanilacus TaxID=2282305 RepID=UPI0015F08717|nr:VWA domain-containing protein [Halomonas montanilacus]
MRAKVTSVACLLTLLLAGSAAAFPGMVFEQEPNDTLEQALSFRGEARLVGEVSGYDRDLFRWALDDAETDRLWHLELQGDGALDAELFWPGEEAAGGSGVATFGAEPTTDASAERTLLTLSVAPGGDGEGREPLMVPAGEHLIRFLPQDTGGEYRLSLTSGDRIRIRGTVGPDRTDDIAVEPGRQWYFQLNVPDATIPLIPEEDPRQLWRVVLVGELGAPLEAWITDEEGEVIVEAVEGAPLQQAWGRLELPEGSRLHVRHVEGNAIGRLGARMSEDGRRREESIAAEDMAEEGRDSEEVQVAGSPETRHWLDGGEEIALTMERNERRYLAFPVGSDEEAWTLGAVSDDMEQQLEVCLKPIDSRDEVCRIGLSENLFSRMSLPEGDYALMLRSRARGGEPVTFTLRLDEDEPAPEGWVDRPNDIREWAVPMLADAPIHGRFEGRGEAWFALQVGGEVQQWAFTTESESPLERLGVHRVGDGSLVLEHRRTGRGDHDLWLEHVRLLPGRYLVRLLGEGTDYRLLASPTGQPEPGFEQEPNDEDRDANPLWLGEPLHGSFHSLRDQDRFHFHLPGRNRVVLEFEPPEGGEMDVGLEWQGETRLRYSVDKNVRLDSLLPPGDYTLVLGGDAASRARYSARVTIADPWNHVDMPIPALRRDEAPLLPEDAVISSSMGGAGGDGGFLRLPVTEEDRDVFLEGRFDSLGSAYTGLEFRTDDGDMLEVQDTEERGRHVVTIPGGEAATLEVSFGRAGRDVSLSDPAYPLPAAPQLELNLTTEAQRLPPFAPTGQRLASRLRLVNPEDEPQTLTLEAHVSHDGASVSGLPEAIELAPGEETELPLNWTLPPNMLENAPLSLFVRAGERVLRKDIALDPLAPAVGSFNTPDVPKPLQGLADLAWNAFGATFVDAGSGEPIDTLPGRGRSYPYLLIDGMAGSGSSIEVSNDLGEALPPIRLADEGGLVRGVVFNQRSSHDHSDRWREVEIALGDDLDTFEVVETLELASGDGEQFFELDTPREARYVQLRPLSVWDHEAARRRTHGSGLLRVLGEPAGQLARRRHDLLDPELGGHWVHTRPDISSLYGFKGHRSTARGVMGDNPRGERIRDRTLDMVFAFLHQRAARIDELEWIENLDWEGQPVEQVSVYTATESPVGPWEHQADWNLARDDEGVASLPLPASPRVRYLRLVFDEPEEGEGRRENTWRPPEALRAYEADSLGSGRSILGHWGMDHSRGPLEAERSTTELALAAVEDTDSHAGRPLTLTSRITGRVEEPGDSRHYRIDLEEGDNTLAFALQESLRGRLKASLTDPEGGEVPLAWRDGQGGQRFAEALDLVPGTYRLTMAEPPRSVVFLWDGSGSVAKHQPAIYQALNRFAEGLQPGREVFNMLPLGGPLLIDGWAESPSQVAQTLNGYNGRYSDSDSEPALKLATRALASQEGEKAIFLITDAEQLGRDMSVWNDLETVRPRIFTLEISHGSRREETNEYRWYQDQMLSWAHVGGGTYRYTTGRSELIRAFEAGMRELRQPTTFALEVERRYQEPPEPGSLRVASGDAPVVAAGVVHLIFDASGSMLQQMEGGRRIQVARRIVQQVLDERVPETVPVALRAFGHTEPHSCATELLVAPGDDNHAQVRRAVEDIQAINLARTPLADSLDAVLDDLASYEGQRRLVVMLTDGEETCEGDLEQSVADLIEEGLDVRLNIVGFHIDEIGLQAEFERFAELGGGEYFDSHDGEELVEGLAGALAAPWRVLDAAGSTVARGRVDGEAIELDVGDYTLVVEAQEGDRHHTFSIAPRQAKEVRLSEALSEPST